MRASKEEEWKKRCKILDYCSGWTLCLLLKESSLGAYCWIPFLRHAWKDKTVEMHKWLVVAMEQGRWGADWRRRHRRAPLQGWTVWQWCWWLHRLYSRQCPFAHTERWIHNSHRQRWRGEGGRCTHTAKMQTTRDLQSAWTPGYVRCCH